jgi:hypothetical protein
VNKCLSASLLRLQYQISELFHIFKTSVTYFYVMIVHWISSTKWSNKTNILTIMDNCPAHIKVEILSNIEANFFRWTHFGFEEVWPGHGKKKLKELYRKLLLSSVAENLDTFQSITEFSKSIVKGSIIWVTAICSPSKVNRHFGGTCRLHLRGRPRRWRPQVPPKRQSTFNGLHGIITTVVWEHQVRNICAICYKYFTNCWRMEWS